MAETGTTEARKEHAGGRIVVGFDGSGSSQVAVAWAADEAARRGVPLDVLYAADYTGLVGDFGGSSLPESAHHEAGNSAQAGARIARARQPGIEVSPLVFAGAPAAGLVDESAVSSLVVVGARGRGELAALALGSVSTAVAAHARCAVVVVRGGEAVRPSPNRPVVVGVDGTPASEDALRLAVEAARAGGATLKIVSAWPTVREDWLRAYWASVDPHADPDREARRAAEHAAAAAAARVADLAPDVTAKTYAYAGHPARVIVDVANDDAALVVVGSRGRGSVAGLLLGSVGHGVVHAARCPVVLVKHRRPT
jgi:nucleotide-binding universal stress UspA family protein